VGADCIREILILGVGVGIGVGIVFFSCSSFFRRAMAKSYATAVPVGSLIYNKPGGITIPS
jgi:ABC-type lipoprotein release transport system permease subunit